VGFSREDPRAHYRPEPATEHVRRRKTAPRAPRRPPLGLSDQEAVDRDGKVDLADHPVVEIAAFVPGYARARSNAWRTSSSACTPLASPS
jgi:hypothetical protein